ncbi:hypothetical protein AgCh_034344 [Apium graveolens]
MNRTKLPIREQIGNVLQFPIGVDVVVAEVLYTLGGLENLHTTKKYYASTIDLTGGKNTRALMGIYLCTAAIIQLTKGRNKEDKESFELQSLVVTALEKDYMDRSPNSLSLLTSTLKSLQIKS